MKPTSIQLRMAQAVEEHLKPGFTAMVFTAGHHFSLTNAKVEGGVLGALILGVDTGGHLVEIDVTQILAVRLDSRAQGAFTP
ncbi:hypothetical protein [Sphingobium yanoikuyae]|uniref:hypothetical protein n=1 Tax=Sphingobium yanoikuyae TaxID=13690 RepID=UPI000262C8EC|nr:hypothetical protein [Sphingobium yanoikuyae]